MRPETRAFLQAGDGHVEPIEVTAEPNSAILSVDPEVAAFELEDVCSAKRPIDGGQSEHSFPAPALEDFGGPVFRSGHRKGGQQQRTCSP
jgi:hypothetical protein